MNSNSPLQWKRPWQWELDLLKAMEVLFEKNPELLSYIFDKNEARLRLTPDRLIEESYSLRCEQRLLIRIALDLWNGTGAVAFCSLIDHLDHDSFQCVLSALRLLGPRRTSPYHPQIKAHRRPDTAWADALRAF